MDTSTSSSSGATARPTLRGRPSVAGRAGLEGSASAESAGARSLAARESDGADARGSERLREEGAERRALVVGEPAQEREPLLGAWPAPRP